MEILLCCLMCTIISVFVVAIYINLTSKVKNLKRQILYIFEQLRTLDTKIVATAKQTNRNK